MFAQDGSQYNRGFAPAQYAPGTMAYRAEEQNRSQAASDMMRSRPASAALFETAMGEYKSRMFGNYNSTPSQLRNALSLFRSGAPIDQSVNYSYSKTLTGNTPGPNVPIRDKVI